jgi:hypothetical protein
LYRIPEMSEPTVPTNLRLPRSLDRQVREVAERWNVPRNTAIKIVLSAFIEEGAARTVPEALAALATHEGAAMMRQLAGQVEPTPIPAHLRRIRTQGVLS